MKPEALLRTVALFASSSLLVTSLMAADEGTSSSTSESSSTRGARSSVTFADTGSAEMSHKSERLSQLMGTTVKNAQGETMGQLNDFVVDPASGRIQFAIISLSDPSQSGKLAAVPWSLARMGAEPNSIVLNVDKDKLASAQTFDATSWPDFDQTEWIQKTYSHFGVKAPSWKSMGGHVPTGGSATGTDNSDNSDTKHNIDNGTAPDGRGTFNQGTDVKPQNQATPNNRDRNENP
jgi:sporulation protein YlmC with PRC-barrel domain